jgi:hypothetical protein
MLVNIPYMEHMGEEEGHPPEKKNGVEQSVH